MQGAIRRAVAMTKGCRSAKDTLGTNAEMSKTQTRGSRARDVHQTNELR